MSWHLGLQAFELCAPYIMISLCPPLDLHLLQQTILDHFHSLFACNLQTNALLRTRISAWHTLHWREKKWREKKCTVFLSWACTTCVSLRGKKRERSNVQFFSLEREEMYNFSLLSIHYICNLQTNALLRTSIRAWHDGPTCVGMNRFIATVAAIANAVANTGGIELLRGAASVLAKTTESHLALRKRRWPAHRSHLCNHSSHRWPHLLAALNQCHCCT